MEFRDYQTKAAKTCLPQCLNLEYLTMGLLSEVGEICGKLKRIRRGDLASTKAHNLVLCEVGDTLWYTAMIADVRKIDTPDLPLHNHQMFVTRTDDLAYHEEIAINIATNAMLFIMAPTFAQLRPLLRSLEFLANAFGGSMRKAADYNLAKLSLRKKTGKIAGSGDTR